MSAVARTTHAVLARSLGLPPTLLAMLCAENLVPVLGQHGPHYYVDANGLPGREELIALGREYYRSALQRVVQTAGELVGDFEAIRQDARCALGDADRGDPTGRFGDHLIELAERPPASPRALDTALGRLRREAGAALDAYAVLNQLDVVRAYLLR